MKIKIKDYIIEPCTNASLRYDLYQSRKSKNKETGELYDSLFNIGYGMTLGNCIESIIFEEVNKTKDVTDLKTYLEMYKQVKDEINQLATV